jgi:regulator of cell morphogenesis and NO signaling
MNSQIDTSVTLAELVESHPGLARELERRNLDYCCGGRRTLAEACRRNALDPDDVAAELAATVTDSPAAWSSMGVDDLVDHIEGTHHRYLWDELARLCALIDNVVSVHGGRHPELEAIRACFALVRAELEPHLMKEERVLFPMIRDLARNVAPTNFHCGTLDNPIRVMLADHDAVGVFLARLRVLTNEYAPPADGCASYAACFAALAELEADTHLHVHKENNVLFPAVLRIEAERAAASA